MRSKAYFNQMLFKMRKNWKLSLSAALMLVAAYDTWIDELTVIAATFIGLAALPWLLDLFDKITLPGGVEIDFAKIRKVLDEKEIATPPQTEDGSSFVPDDPNLALVALRIDIERKLRDKFLKGNDVKNGRHISLNRVIDDLASEGFIDLEIASVIRDMLPAMNMAAHGHDVPKSTRTWIQQNGQRLLAALDGTGVTSKL